MDGGADGRGADDHIDVALEAGIASGQHEALCRGCGACCAYSAEWPRFTLEDDAALARIPEAFVDPSGSGMRCAGDRCTALDGHIGAAVACRVYAVRPEVCRECLPGDPECRMARRRFGLDLQGPGVTISGPPFPDPIAPAPHVPDPGPA